MRLTIEGSKGFTFASNIIFLTPQGSPTHGLTEVHVLTHTGGLWFQVVALKGGMGSSRVRNDNNKKL
jgi:hypothetical protein